MFVLLNDIDCIECFDGCLMFVSTLTHCFDFEPNMYKYNVFHCFEATVK